MTDALEIRVEKWFRHPPERVFDAFLDPANVGLWLFATPDGRMEKTEFDPRRGGRFHIVERRGDEAASHRGAFIVIDRPHRIVFDFRVDDAKADPTRVTVEFRPAGDGCDVVLTHQLAPEWADYADRTAGGWSMILNGLQRMMERA